MFDWEILVLDFIQQFLHIKDYKDYNKEIIFVILIILYREFYFMDMICHWGTQVKKNQFM